MQNSLRRSCSAVAVQSRRRSGKEQLAGEVFPHTKPQHLPEVFLGQVAVKNACFYKLVEYCGGSADPAKVKGRFWRALPSVPPNFGHNRLVQLSEWQMLLENGRPFVVPSSAVRWESVRRKLN